jgi:hypothetical protein
MLLRHHLTRVIAWCLALAAAGLVAGCATTTPAPGDTVPLQFPAVEYSK